MSRWQIRISVLLVLGVAMGQAPLEASTKTAVAVLETLAVKGRAPKTGYERSQFGPTWSDVDRNGCDTRNDILYRDLTSKTFKSGTQNCVVLTGVLSDPYSGEKILFVRGVGSSMGEGDKRASDASSLGKGSTSVMKAEKRFSS